MKNILVLAVVMLTAAFAQAEVSKESLFRNLSQVSAAGTWVSLSGICYSGGYTKAREACEDDLDAVNLLSNNKVVFKGSCTSNTTGCAMSASYQLKADVLFVGK